MTESGKRPQKTFRMLLVIMVIIAVASVNTACQSAGTEGKTVVSQEPGTLINGVCLSGDGRFTVKANEEEWRTGQSGQIFELYWKEDGNIWISFSPTEGIDREMIVEFGTSFADSYEEALKEEYPDVRIEEVRQVNDGLAGLLMTMSGGLREHRMYHMIYLASDGENGYFITSALPAKKEAELKPVITQVIESLRFL